MGGRIKLVITGSAAFAEKVLTFVHCALGCIVLEGYRQTECVAPCTVSMEGDYKIGFQKEKTETDCKIQAPRM